MIVTCEKCGTILLDDTYDFSDIPNKVRIILQDKEYCQQQYEFIKSQHNTVLSITQKDVEKIEQQTLRLYELIAERDKKVKERVMEYYKVIIGDYQKWLKKR